MNTPAKKNCNPVYVVAGCKSWNRLVYDQVIRRFPGQWHFIESPHELTVKWVRELHPRYLFFLHWSWIVPPELVENYDCVCFHMTDVPYGRGGSPLQNLIVRGHDQTVLAALKMVPQLDAGPVYLKYPLSLAGTAQEILVRSSQLAAQMVKEMIETHPVPQEQVGPVVAFSRRQPHESQIPSLPSLEAIYDWIRMLDGQSYPPAFIEHEGLRIEFKQGCLYADHVEATVRITHLESSKKNHT